MRNSEFGMRNSEFGMRNSGELTNEILTNHNISVNSAAQMLTKFYLLCYII